MSYYSGKVVWVTGASSGIGEQIVYSLSNAGARIIISSRRRHELEQVKEKCTNPNAVDICVFDQGKENEVRNAVNEVMSKNGRIDILFNNGGVSQRAEALKTSLEMERQIFEINFFGNILLGKLVAEIMIGQKNGHIVVTSSLLGKWGFQTRSAYAASKHALHGYYDSLRFETEKDGIDITLVLPGFIATDISKHALDENGKPTGAMDANQAGGISAEECAKRILEGVSKKKNEFSVGGSETLGLYLRRFIPGRFNKILRKRSPR